MNPIVICGLLACATLASALPEMGRFIGNHQAYAKKESGTSTATFMNTPEAQSFFYDLMSKSEEIPDSVDWRQVENRVTEVGDEKGCASSFAYSAVGALEGQLASRNATFQKLSVQNILDCSFRNLGCQGGWVDWAWMDINKQGGIQAEEDYRYVGHIQYCAFDKSKSVFDVKGGYRLEKENEELLKKTVALFGPVSATIEVTPKVRQYKEGVFSDDDCHSNLKQAVLVVGYGSDPEEGDYWLLKNSWGKGWGINGFMKLARNKKNMCGIGHYAVIPTF